MAGLLDTATGAPPAQPMPPQQGMPPQAGNQPDSTVDDGEEQPNVSPEEQAAYEAFVNNGLEVIYGGEDQEAGARKDILARLKEASDPIENLANTTAWLVTMLETSATKAQAPWTQDPQSKSDILMHGGKAILEELAEVSEAAGIHDYSEKEMEGAWYRGLDIYRESATDSGALDPSQLKGEFDEIQQADQQGQMGQILPGIEGAMEQGAA